jgi:hypothetical protein
MFNLAIRFFSWQFMVSYGNSFIFWQCILMGVLNDLRLMAFSSILLGVFIVGRSIVGRLYCWVFLLLGVLINAI